MKINSKNGFTLIELLVVVAIIGILSSIVMASLNSARVKGADAALKSNLTNMRSQAEIIFADQGCYSSAKGVTCAATAVAPGPCASTVGTVFGSTQFQSVIISIVTGQGKLMACSSTANQTSWAMVAGYKSDKLKGWCVDSTPKSKEIVMADNTVQANVNAEINASGLCVD